MDGLFLRMGVVGPYREPSKLDPGVMACCRKMTCPAAGWYGSAGRLTCRNMERPADVNAALLEFLDQ